MDKLKAQLAAAAPYTFWAMCVGILAVSLASWWMSTATLKTEQQARLTEIQGQFTSVGALMKPDHPNQGTLKGMEELNRSFALKVAEGWKRQYEHQASVLVWPADFDDAFRERVNKMRPIESVPGPVTPIDVALPVEDLQQYRNYIGLEPPKLAETIGAVWTAKSAVGGSGSDGYGAGSAVAGIGPTGSGSQTEVEDKSIVMWDPANQQEILDTHFGFTALSELPSTLEVLYAQEDLWVLQNIMNTIKSANADATARHQAAIKEIHFIRLGRSALGMAGAITPLASAAGQSGNSVNGMPTPGAGGPAGMPSAGGAGPAGMPTPGATAGGSTTGGTPGSSGSSTATTADPAEGRYVDEKYEPLPATRLRNAYKSRTKEDALLAVAKRVPVRLRFQIDQRRLHRVLAEFGNSQLPVEIRQVRINRDPAASSSEGGSSMGGASYATAGTSSASSSAGTSIGGVAGFGGTDSGSLFGSGGSGARGMVKGSVVSDATVDPHLIDIELYGIVYIYNPVNQSQLGLDDLSNTVMAPPAGTPTTGTPTTATTPVSTTPATTTPASTTPAPATPTGPAPSAATGPTPTTGPAPGETAIAG